MCVANCSQGQYTRSLSRCTLCGTYPADDVVLGVEGVHARALGRVGLLLALRTGGGGVQLSSFLRGEAVYARDEDEM